MRWRDARESDNVDDQRGAGPSMGGGGMPLGIGGIAIVVVVSLLLGKNPLELLGLLSQMQGGSQSGYSDQAPGDAQNAPDPNDQNVQFVRAILGETEDVWGDVFQQAGKQYERPHLILFSGAIRSGCGGATTASGPFYCPEDHKVYLDLSFFDEMRARLGGGGDFAYAYVIAHEVGHHVQNQLGVFDQAQRARERGQPMEGATGLSVRQELQADCLAGVWANHAQARHKWLEAGDVDEALGTATAIGDDRLQRQSQGTVVPDAFTHGTSQQRVRWFKAGFEGGDIGNCDTFRAATL
jgi:predicted metalloprotease